MNVPERAGLPVQAIDMERFRLRGFVESLAAEELDVPDFLK